MTTLNLDRSQNCPVGLLKRTINILVHLGNDPDKSLNYPLGFLRRTLNIPVWYMTRDLDKSFKLSSMGSWGGH